MKSFYALMCKIISLKCRLLIGKLRRPFLLYLKKKEVLEHTSQKQGQCQQCANCCRLLFNCPFLSSDNLCQIYRSKVRPQACVHFPIDRRDIQDVLLSSGHQCGYWFDPSPSSNAKS